MNAAAGSRPVVLFVSEIAPTDTSASAVVVHRHLRAIERAGYDVYVVTLARDDLDRQLPQSWTTIPLPTRRFYYPPFRPNAVLRTTRWLLFDRITLPQLKRREIACVVGLLVGEYLAGYAAWLADRLGRPLFYFYHDRGERLHHAADPRAAARLKRLNLGLLRSPRLRTVWTVAPELVYADDGLLEKFRVVYPLPQALGGLPQPRWNSAWTEAPVLVHLGTIYREIVPALRVICSQLRASGGRLMLFSHFSETAKLIVAEFPDVATYPGFLPDAAQMFERIVAEGAAFIVVYPNAVEDMPWSLDCFPSKFTQSVQTGLPGVVFAPPETSVGRWCLAHEWPLYRPFVDAGSVGSVLDVLRDEAGWSTAAAASRAAAGGVFDPGALERHVVDDIAAAAAQ